MLPIYTKYIPPAGYGTYDLMNAYVSFLTAVLYLDIWNGVMRFMFDYKEREQKYKAIYNGLSIFALSSIVYTLIVLVISFTYPLEYIWLVFLFGLLLNMQNLFSYIVRGFGKNVLYVCGGLTGSVVTVIMNLILLIGLRMDYSALYISSCVGYLANITVLITGGKILRLHFVHYFDKALFRSMLRFSLPLCLNSAAYWFLTSFNRVIIANSLGEEYNGIYAVAGKFSLAVTLFTSCFQMAWQEMSFSKGAREENLDTFYTKSINMYIKFLCLGIACVSPAVMIVFPWFIDAAYASASDLVPLYLLATVASALSSFLGSVFGSIKKTKHLFTTTLVSCIVNYGIIALTIQLIGLQAANISLFMGFLINIILRILLLRKDIKIKIDFKFLLFFILFFAAEIVVMNVAGMIGSIVVLLLAGLLFLYVFREPIKNVVNGLILRKKG